MADAAPVGRPSSSDGGVGGGGGGGGGAQAAWLTCPAGVLPDRDGQQEGQQAALAVLVSQQQRAARAGTGGREAEAGRRGQGGGRNAICATGSTWARLPRALLTQHVNAVGEKLGIYDGASVLDVGATCGHGLSILQESHHHTLKAFGIDGARTSVKYAQRTQGHLLPGQRATAQRHRGGPLRLCIYNGRDGALKEDVCRVAREIGRVVGRRACDGVSVPKADCAVTKDEEWGCPRCYWMLRGIEKRFGQSACSKGAGVRGGRRRPGGGRR